MQVTSHIKNIFSKKYIQQGLFALYVLSCVGVYLHAETAPAPKALALAPEPVGEAMAVAACNDAIPVWTTYCTGGSDPNGNNWQWWQYDNSVPANYQFLRTGDGACVPPSSDPIGSHDTAQCSPGAITGWACDPDNYAAPIYVHIYRDGPAGVGAFVASVLANTVRESAVGSACGGGTSYHGFTYPTLTDGDPHSYYVYAINDGANGGINNPLLTNSPKSATCSPNLPGSIAMCVNGNCANPPAAPGSTRTLSWNCPAPYTSSSGVGFSTGGVLSGSITVAPTETTTYEVHCNPGDIAANLTALVADPQLTLTAPTPRVRPNESTTLVWGASQVDSCTLLSPSGATLASASSDSSGNITSHTTQTAVITGKSTYTLRCQTALGARSVSVDVGLIPRVNEI